MSEFQRIFTESGQNIRDLLVKAVESFSLHLYYLLQLKGTFNCSSHTSNKRRKGRGEEGGGGGVRRSRPGSLF